MKFIRKSKASEQQSGGPAWIVSFTDMVTLLLAFFVLLQSFASMQDPELFFLGRDAFKRAIAGLGIPGLLLGKPAKFEQQHHRRKHPMEAAEHKIPKNRMLDIEDEKIRQAFANMKQNLDTNAADIHATLVERRFLSLSFDGRNCELAQPSRRQLTGFLTSLEQNIQGQAVAIYVIGLSDVDKPVEAMMLSAKRARTVHRFLVERCSPAAREFGWEFSSWGAGSHSQWLEGMGQLPGGSNVVIVVTRKE